MLLRNSAESFFSFLTRSQKYSTEKQRKKRVLPQWSPSSVIPASFTKRRNMGSQWNCNARLQGISCIAVVLALTSSDSKAASPNATRPRLWKFRKNRAPRLRLYGWWLPINGLAFEVWPVASSESNNSGNSTSSETPDAPHKNQTIRRKALP